MTSVANQPKAILYHFTPGSVWSAVPVLTALEKGFGESQLEKRLVNLGAGENFSPAFLKISPKGTIPALVAPYEHTVTSDLPTKFKSLTTTISICQFLDSSTLSSSHQSPSLSPATVQGNNAQNDIIEMLHKDEADPNFLGMSFRNHAERDAKCGGRPGGFLRGRKEALLRYQKENDEGDEDPRLAKFYELKIRDNDALLALYDGADCTGFIAASTKAWANLGTLVEWLETQLSSTNTYMVGDQICLADLHGIAYFARVLAASGATSIDDIPGAIAKLDAGLGEKKVGPKLASWIDAVFKRDSVKEVYKDGFH